MKELQQVIQEAGNKKVESFLKRMENSGEIDKATLELCRVIAVDKTSSYSAVEKVSHIKGIKIPVNTLRYKVRKAITLLYRGLTQWDPEEGLHEFRKRGSIQVPSGMVRVVSEMLRANKENFEKVIVLKKVSSNAKPRTGGKANTRQ